MAQKIKVQVDVDSESVTFASDRTLTLTEQVRLLRKELQKVPEGTKEWTLLQQKFNETKDALDRVNVKSKELFGTLGALPGPIGNISSELDGTIGTLKVFSKIKVSDIGTQFKELGKDLKEIGVGLLELTGITKVYEVATAGASKVLQFFGVSAEGAAGGARAFGVAIAGITAATGLILLTALISQVSAAYDYFSTRAERAAEAQKNLNDSIQRGNEAALDAESAYVKRSGDLLVAQAKARGATAKEIYNIEQQNRELLLASQERYYKDVKDKDSKEGMAALKAIKDSKSGILVAEANFQAETYKTGVEAAKKTKEKRDNDIKELNKAEEQARVDRLTGQQKELAAVDLKYKDLIAKEKLYHRDTKVLTDAADAEKTAINKKFEDEKIKATDEFLKKLGQISIAAIKDDTDRAIATREEKLSNDLRDLEKDKEFIKLSEEAKTNYRKELTAASENDIAKIKLDAKVKAGEDELSILTAQQKTLQEGTQAYLDNSIAIENQAFEIKVLNAKDNADKIKAINIEHEQNIKDIRLKAAIAEKQIQLDRLNVIAGIGNSLAQLAGKNKALAIAAIAIEKAAAIGSIIVNTQIANLKAVAASPLTFGQPWVTINTIAGVLAATAAIASGVKAVQDINSVQIPGASGAGAAGGGGGGSTPSMGAAPSAAAPNIGSSAVSSEGKLGAIITNASTEQGTRPIQTYVVGSNVSTQQQLDRRVSLAAKMGG